MTECDDLLLYNTIFLSSSQNNNQQNIYLGAAFDAGKSLLIAKQNK